MLDTETTGKDNSAEIVEIAIVNKSGEALLDALIRSYGGVIPVEVTEVHGITYGMTYNGVPVVTGQKPTVSMASYYQQSICHAFIGKKAYYRRLR